MRRQLPPERSYTLPHRATTGHPRRRSSMSVPVTGGPDGTGDIIRTDGDASRPPGVMTATPGDRNQSRSYEALLRSLCEAEDPLSVGRDDREVDFALFVFTERNDG